MVLCTLFANLTLQVAAFSSGSQSPRKGKIHVGDLCRNRDGKAEDDLDRIGEDSESCGVVSLASCCLQPVIFHRLTADKASKCNLIWVIKVS